MANLPDDEQVWIGPYAAVRCHGDSIPGQKSCGQVTIDEAEYIRQMNRPDSLWMCPHCGSTADFDDGFFEEMHNVNDTEAPDELYNRVSDLVRTHGTDAVRGICDALDAEAREHG